MAPSFELKNIHRVWTIRILPSIISTMKQTIPFPKNEIDPRVSSELERMILASQTRRVTVTAQKSVVLALLMKLPINFQKVLLSQYKVYSLADRFI
jgi:hypothetical protein